MASSCHLCRLFSKANCQIRQTGLILADPVQDAELSYQQTVSTLQALAWIELVVCFTVGYRNKIGVLVSLCVAVGKRIRY